MGQFSRRKNFIILKIVRDRNNKLMPVTDNRCSIQAGDYWPSNLKNRRMGAKDSNFGPLCQETKFLVEFLIVFICYCVAVYPELTSTLLWF